MRTGRTPGLKDFQSSRLTHSYGPARGALKHDPGYISGHSNEVWARNFVAEAEFVNPGGNDWDYGFAFRNPEFNRLEIIGITDHPLRWFHKKRDVNDAQYTYRGIGFIPAANFHRKNHLLLIAVAETGWFWVNEHLIARLDLSHNLAYGDGSAMAGFSGEHTGEPKFQNFNVWIME